MNMKESLLNGVTAVTGICAIVVTIHAIHAHPSGPTTVGTELRAVSAAVWRPLLATGHRLGPADAKLTMIEFADFQCPVCGAFEQVIDSMRVRHPREFTVVFHHFPLSYHPLAMPLARAAECADRQGRFEAFHDSVYAEQRLLGVVPVLEFAKRAGVRDLAAFTRCEMDTTAVPSITQDVADGIRIGIPGTPAVIVGGMMHAADLSVADLERLLHDE